MSQPLPSLLVSRYQLTRLLGEGGFAETYLATDTVLGRPMAIKLLRQQLAQDPGYVARFNREACIAASINHPNVIAVHDFGQDGALLFLVMEWVNGTTLKQLIREQAPLPIPEAKRLIGQVLQGLGAIHRAGIIHRDVKPQNVLLDTAGTIKLTDFGIAKAPVGKGLGELTHSGEFLGTPTRMAPEQVLGAKTLGPEADLYGVNVLLFELLTGELPFSGDTPLQVALKQLHEPPPAMRLFNQTIPAELGGVVLKALAKEPGARYQSAAAMEVALLESDADQLGPATRIQAAREETATQREGSGTEPERPLIPSSMNIGQLAGFRARLAAGLGDWLILLVPVAILLALARLTNADALAGLVILLIPIEAIAYFVFFWHRHQTPAMKVLHLELAGPEESGGSATGRLCCAASAIW